MKTKLIALLAVVITLSACGRSVQGGSPSPSPQVSPTPTAKIVTVTIAAGNVGVSESRLDVSLNETVRIEITSDRPDEIHVHGYEIKAAVKSGETTVVEFVADLPGIFEVEIHTGHQKLFDLRVS